MALPPQVNAATRVLREVGAYVRATRANEIRHRPDPPQSGLVVDLGSGQAPHPQADLIVDKYVVDDFERGSALVIDKPLVVADGHALPFADQAFSYIITSHVLEHATDVVQFAAELQRVAGAGFIQVPSRQAELTFGWPFHPWLIDLDGATLVFHPRGEAAAPDGPYFHRAFADSALFALWFGAHREHWHHTLHWERHFAVRVDGASAAPQTADLDVERTLEGLGAMTVTGPTGALRATLRCPNDRGVLVDDAGRLTCADCGRSYPVANGVPVLLAEAAA
jgi:Methyltransferase domain